MSARLTAASLLAGAVIGLTATAYADPSAPAEAPASAATAETPLALRPTKPLELSREPASGGSTGWKVGAVVVVLGAAAFFARRKMQPRLFDDARLNIVRRAAIGFRSELVVVDVEGQRLLLGVTPHTIQTLATLDADAASPALGAQDPAPVMDERFSALLESADRRPSRGRAEAAPPAAAPREEPAPVPDEVAGQARGLLALRGRR